MSKHRAARLLFLSCAVAALGTAAASTETPAADFFTVSTGNVTINDLGEEFALVFSNEVSTTITLSALENCMLKRILVVGGGGAGGNVMGGGGGGGQVLEISGEYGVVAGETITLVVGAGGATASASGMLAGKQGGTSSVSLHDGTSFFAYGGGGGGGFSAKEPTSNADGEIGSGGGNAFGRTTAYTKGSHYNYGNSAGAGAQSGGGGAGEPGESAGIHAESVLYGTETSYRKQAGYGGEGIASDISGTTEIYGSGGGGGGGQDYWSQIHAPGGTHAGAGAVRTDKSGGGDGTKHALPADDGYGAGGGGGSFSQTGSSGPGNASKGGSGTVVLRFSKIDRTALLFHVEPIADQFYTGEAVTPLVSVNHIYGGTAVDPVNYDVELSDNVEPGSVVVTVTGKGEYEGVSYETSFTILPCFADDFVSFNSIPESRSTFESSRSYFLEVSSDIPAVVTARRPVTIISPEPRILQTGEAYTNSNSDASQLLVTILPGVYNSENMFAIANIESMVFEGICEPDVLVTNISSGAVLRKGVDYRLIFTNNTQTGFATVYASGLEGSAYAGFLASALFEITPGVYDKYVKTDDLGVRMLNSGGNIVYVFTNTTDTFTLTTRTNMTLKALLVCGGGGGGGNTIGGGGGGGAVVTSETTRVILSGKSFSIDIGKGGVFNPSGGFTTSYKGESTTLTFPDGSETVAYGGGGGGGYQKTPSSTTSGDIASGGGSGGGGSYPGTVDGTYYTSLFGHAGAAGEYNYGGGGGGAGGAPSSTRGGEGIVSSMTGVDEVYGSGGGGGARDSNAAGAGGTNAGGGTNGNATVNAPSGRTGFGGGGGGGGYKRGGACDLGGNGGSGTIILSFVPGGDIGQPTIDQSLVTFPGGITQPKLTLVLGNSKAGTTFTATVTVTLRDESGVILSTKEFLGVLPGQTLEWLSDVCVPAGTVVVSDVMVTCDGAITVSHYSETIATGSLSPHYGRGGGSRVIHVRAGATGRCDGSDWFNAYHDFRQALGELSDERPEIWFAGDESAGGGKVTISPDAPAVIRGGFSGTENSPAERAPGEMSVTDADGVSACFTFANSHSVTLDGFHLLRGSSRNLYKEGAGDILVTNCVISDIDHAGAGIGCYIKGSSSSTVAKFSDVRFSNIFGAGSADANSGTVLYLTALSRVYIDNCTFSTNGCTFSTGFSNPMYRQIGSVIYANGVPLTVRHTRFLANRSQSLDFGGGSGSVIEIRGACGETAFTNCFFIGNEVVHGYLNTSSYSSDNAGMLTVRSTSGSVDIENCTFTLGLGAVTCGTGGIAVRSGDVRISNSIFYGNTNTTWNTGGLDVHVAAEAAANVSYCLFEDDSARRIVCEDGASGDIETDTFTYGTPGFVSDENVSSFLTSTGIGFVLASRKMKDIAAFNTHLRGGYGYRDERTGEIIRTYSRDADSPAIDAGDPGSSYANEPDLSGGWHGRRVNLGAYGNTPYATMSTYPGMILRVR